MSHLLAFYITYSMVSLTTKFERVPLDRIGRLEVWSDGYGHMTISRIFDTTAKVTITLYLRVHWFIRSFCM